jgi:hypothetical protein
MKNTKIVLLVHNNVHSVSEGEKTEVYKQNFFALF